MLDVPYFDLLLFFNLFFFIIVMLLICYYIRIEESIDFKDFHDIIYYAATCIISLGLGVQILGYLSMYSVVFLFSLGPLGVLIFYLVIVTIIIVIIVRIRRHKKV